MTDFPANASGDHADPDSRGNAGNAGSEAAPRHAHRVHTDSAHPLALLRDPQTVRLRCAAILRSVEANVSEHWTLDRTQLAPTADRVAALTQRRFPDLRIPYHSRWRHFEAGGTDRRPLLDAQLSERSISDAARARFDLTVVSVLLDAGAGAAWSYTEPGTAQVLQRSEGLGVASWHAFMAGTFSATPGDPLRADAAALEKIDAAALRAVFQSSPSNPLVGLEGRAGLLSRLGAALKTEAHRTGLQARPALLYDRLTAGGTRAEVGASAVLAEVLRAFGPIWTSGSRVQGLPAGDVWPHRWAGAAVAGTAQGWSGPARCSGDRPPAPTPPPSQGRTRRRMAGSRSTS